ncbi:hypothetical protein O181_039874 [Austropuccinia psidii MF-1]|uniref:Uncharacterized protein n=1 Tax=Austropuccinia psidii MF-1 TaxID=1389203 RepID=A0A9Q3DBB0_9BASI|nr:hypothetical protein [Austropuccinia psidii MF-1]
MLPQIYQGVMNCWHILKKLLNEKEIVKYSNEWNNLSSKPQIKRIKEWHNKTREETKGEAPVSSTRKPEANKPPQEEKTTRKIIGENYIPPVPGSQESKQITWKMF